MCVVKNFTPNSSIASPSRYHVEGEAFALHTTAMPQHLFQTTTLLQDKLSYIQSDSRAVRSVWHGHSHSKREACIWEPHKWIIKLMPLISVLCSATQSCSLSHVLWSLPMEMPSVSKSSTVSAFATSVWIVHFHNHHLLQISQDQSSWSMGSAWMFTLPMKWLGSFRRVSCSTTPAPEKPASHLVDDRALHHPNHGFYPCVLTLWILL